MNLSWALVYLSRPPDVSPGGVSGSERQRVVIPAKLATASASRNPGIEFKPGFPLSRERRTRGVSDKRSLHSEKAPDVSPGKFTPDWNFLIGLQEQDLPRHPIRDFPLISHGAYRKNLRCYYRAQIWETRFVWLLCPIGKISPKGKFFKFLQP